MAESKSAEEPLDTAENYVQIYLLQLEIVKALDLVKADTFGKSDPYCRVSAFKQVYTTKVIMKTLNPVWNEKTQFCFFNDPHELKVEVWDWDKGTKDDPIGDVMFSTQGIFDEGNPGFDGVLQLQNVKKGEVHIKVKGRRLMPLALEQETDQLQDLQREQEATMERQMEDLKVLNEDIRALEEANRNLNAEVQMLQGVHSGVVSELDNLTKEGEALGAEQSALSAEKGTLEKETETLNTRVGNLRGTLETENDNLARANAEKEELQREIRALREQIAGKEEEFKNLEQELEEARKKPNPSGGKKGAASPKNDTKSGSKQGPMDTQKGDGAGAGYGGTSSSGQEQEEAPQGGCSCCVVL